jgi:DNA polymerase-3 subunit alpha (Gram-positive type)
MDGLIDELRAQSVMVNGFFDKTCARIEEDRLIITLHNGGLEALERSGCAARLGRIIENRFGLHIDVLFEGNGELGEGHSVLAELKKLESEPMTCAASPQARKAAITFDAAGLDIVEQSMQMLCGNAIRGKPVALGDIREDSGKVVVWGEVFRLEEKDSRDNSRKIFTIAITDYTGAIFVKAVLDTQSSAAMQTLKTGETVVVHGDAQFDKYLREVAIRAFSIARVERRPRTDDAREKRVELHAHTKMSAMDGLASTEDLICAAANFGHPAIAITDHGVVQSFPEAAKTARDLAKKGKPIKILYGVEGYLVNDMIPAVTGKGDSPLAGEIIVFDLETTGLSAATERIIEIGAVKLNNLYGRRRIFLLRRPERTLGRRLSN